MASIHSPSKISTAVGDRDFWQLPVPLPDAQTRLHHLEEAICADLAVVSYPGRSWNYSRDPRVLEVAIIGAGQAGKSVAFGLRQRGISHVRIFDQRSPEQAGVWRTFARNAKLRSPKKITGGLDWGLPNLNFRRWCAACYGDEYWQRIQFIPRLLWAEYLDWYGKVLDLPIQYETAIEQIRWDAAHRCFILQVRQPSKQPNERPDERPDEWPGERPAETYRARFVILATGMECAGGRNIPPIVQAHLPSHRYAHTMDDLDFAQMQGKRVMILGGGASAFDNALLALEAGAKQVDMAIRRPHLPNLNRIRWSEWNGYHRHYIDLPDAMKWAYSLSELRLGQLPPAHTYHQVMKHDNFTLYTRAPLVGLTYDPQPEGEIVGEYGWGSEVRSLRHDLLICATGFITDLDRQLELQALAPHIARWQDCFTPPPGQEHAEMARFPYLGKSLEFLPRSPEHDYLRRCYYPCCGAAYLSGFRANLTDLQFALTRIVEDIGRQLFIEHQAEIYADFEAYDVAEY